MVGGLVLGKAENMEAEEITLGVIFFSCKYWHFLDEEWALKMENCTAF